MLPLRLYLVLILIALHWPTVALAGLFSPPGWTQEFTENLVIARSPSDELGYVTIITPMMVPVEGDYRRFVPAVARNLAEDTAQEHNATIVKFEPSGPIAEILNTERRPFSFHAELKNIEGTIVHAHIYAVPGSQLTGKSADKNSVQLVITVAPDLIYKSSGVAWQRYWDATRQVEAQYTRRMALTEASFPLYRAKKDEADLIKAKAAPLFKAPSENKAPVQSAAPITQPGPSPAAAPVDVIWSAFGNSRGVAFISPCGADGLSVTGILRRREYTGTSNMLPMLIDDTRATVQAWSGGQANQREGPTNQQGRLLSKTVEFNVPGGRLLGWFAILHRSDNFVQRGYVLAPVSLANDEKFKRIRATIQKMMLDQHYGELTGEGDPPAQSGSNAIEGVFNLSGLARALDAKPLSLTPIEIGLFKNGGATETSHNLTGVWRQFPGGYSVEYSSGEGYVARISDTCRTAATTASRPSPPPATAIASGGRACSSSGIELNFPRATSREECSMIGGQKYCRQVTTYVDSKTTVHPRC